MFPEPFNPELTRILDRVYGVHLVDGVDRAANPIKTDIGRLRRRRGAEALERALEDLRQVRERTEGMATMKDELAFLHGRIAELKALGDEITRLRLQLVERQPDGGTGEATAAPAASDARTGSATATGAARQRI